MEWENKFANDATDEELISKIYKQLIHTTHYQINQTTQSKSRHKI